jgi:hypothetical protein
MARPRLWHDRPFSEASRQLSFAKILYGSGMVFCPLVITLCPSCLL